VERHVYAGDSASVGHVGRVAKADFRAGDGYVGKGDQRLTPNSQIHILI